MLSVFLVDFDVDLHVGLDVVGRRLGGLLLLLLLILLLLRLVRVLEAGPDTVGGRRRLRVDAGALARRRVCKCHDRLRLVHLRSGSARPRKVPKLCTDAPRQVSPRPMTAKARHAHDSRDTKSGRNSDARRHHAWW